MAVLTFELQAGHAITIGLALLGYLVVSLLAAGKMSADLRNMKKRQDEMPTKSDLAAAVATMKSDMLMLLNEKRHDTEERRKSSRRSSD